MREERRLAVTAHITHAASTGKSVSGDTIIVGEERKEEEEMGEERDFALTSCPCWGEKGVEVNELRLDIFQLAL